MITDLKGFIDLRLLLMTSATFISDDLVLWSKLVGDSGPYRQLAGPDLDANSLLKHCLSDPE